MADLDLAARRLAQADPQALDALLSRLEAVLQDRDYPMVCGTVRGIVERARMEWEWEVRAHV